MPKNNSTQQAESRRVAKAITNTAAVATANVAAVVKFYPSIAKNLGNMHLAMGLGKFLESKLKNPKFLEQMKESGLACMAEIGLPRDVEGKAEGEARPGFFDVIVRMPELTEEERHQFVAVGIKRFKRTGPCLEGRGRVEFEIVKPLVDKLHGTIVVIENPQSRDTLEAVDQDVSNDAGMKQPLLGGECEVDADPGPTFAEFPQANSADPDATIVCGDIDQPADELREAAKVDTSSMATAVSASAAVVQSESDVKLPSKELQDTSPGSGGSTMLPLVEGAHPLLAAASPDNWLTKMAASPATSAAAIAASQGYPTHHRRPPPPRTRGLIKPPGTHG